MKRESYYNQIMKPPSSSSPALRERTHMRSPVLPSIMFAVIETVPQKGCDRHKLHFTWSSLCKADCTLVRMSRTEWIQCPQEVSRLDEL